MLVGDRCRPFVRYYGCATGIEEIVDRARSVLALRARADAAEVEFLASLDSGSESDSLERRSLAEALAPELRLPPQGVWDRIHTALALTYRMPRLLQAMREGQVDRYCTERVLNVVAPVSDSDTLEVDRLLEEKLSRLSLTAWQPRNTAWHASRIVQQVDPGAETAAARMAHERRKVTLDHGTSSVTTPLGVTYTSTHHTVLDPNPAVPVSPVVRPRPRHG
ncbi:DUF222 domain-containing protein [Saccharomonospora sp. CUA-673]|uniref:DUF222 domain-containing protein n=1 Tax=Saccharomonospora sp. CUA-673 TaxID=1904969 RepID=UPI0009F85BF0